MDLEHGGSAVAKKKTSKSDFHVLTIEGSAKWYAWVKGLADAERRSMAEEVDFALAERAKLIGYEEPPKRRG